MSLVVCILTKITGAKEWKGRQSHVYLKTRNYGYEKIALNVMLTLDSPYIAPQHILKVMPSICTGFLPVILPFSLPSLCFSLFAHIWSCSWAQLWQLLVAFAPSVSDRNATLYVRIFYPVQQKKTGCDCVFNNCIYSYSGLMLLSCWYYIMFSCIIVIILLHTLFWLPRQKPVLGPSKY